MPPFGALKVGGRWVTVQALYRFNLPAAFSPVHAALAYRLMGSAVFISSIT